MHVQVPTFSLVTSSLSLLTRFCLTSVTFSISAESALLPKLLSLVEDNEGVSTSLVGVASVIVGCASNNSSILVSLLPVELESVFGIEFTPTVAEVDGAAVSLSLIEGTPPLGRKGVVPEGGGGATSCLTTELNLW